MKKQWNNPRVMELSTKETREVEDHAWHLHFSEPFPAKPTESHVCPKCGTQLRKGTFYCGEFDNHVLNCGGGLVEVGPSTPSTPQTPIVPSVPLS